MPGMFSDHSKVFDVVAKESRMAIDAVHLRPFSFNIVMFGQARIANLPEIWGMALFSYNAHKFHFYA
jgi:hypothetical protein